MKIIFALLFAFCIAFYSCKKEQNPSLVEPTPYTPSHKTFILSEELDSVQLDYNYDALWRIVNVKRSVDGTLKEQISWVKSGTQIKKTSNTNPYVYTYYLNKKGFADSISVIYSGYVYLTERFVYNKDGYPISKKITGTVLSNPYEEDYTYEFLNGDLIKQTQVYEGQSFMSTYTYYTDSANIFAGTDEAMTFVPQSKHLIKRITQEDETFVDFVYTQLSQNEIIIQTTNEELISTEKLVKLKFLD